MAKEPKLVKVIVIRPLLYKKREWKANSELSFDSSVEAQAELLKSLLARKLVILADDFDKFLKQAEKSITKAEIKERAIHLINAPKTTPPQEV